MSEDDGREGGGGGNAKVEKRLVSFINFIVDKRIFLLPRLFMDDSPYKYSCNIFSNFLIF